MSNEEVTVAFMVPCPNNDRAAPTLLSLILEHIVPNTTIVSDAWKAYRNISNLENQHYAHDWLVHKYNFVDPRDPSIHTIIVEGMWGNAKDRFRYMHGTPSALFDLHLQEFVAQGASN